MGVLTSLRTLQKRVNEENTLAVAKIRSSLDRKQRKLLIELLEIVSTILSKASCPKGTQCLEDIKREVLDKYQVH